MSLLAVVSPLLTTGPAGAAPTSVAGAVAAPVPSDEAILEVTGTDPVLDDVAVVADADTRRADDRLTMRRREVESAARALDDGERSRADVVARSADAAATERRSEVAVLAARQATDGQRRVLAERQAVTDRRRAALDAEQERLRALGVSMFISKPNDDTIFLGTFEEMSVGGRRQALRGQVVADQVSATDGAERQWRVARGASRAQQRRLDRTIAAERAARRTLARDRQRRSDLAAFQRRAEEIVLARRADLDRADEARREAQIDLRKARLLDRVQGLDLPLVALHAYWRAASVAPCPIPWWMLAGVGRVETLHGTAQGAELRVDGTTSKRIVGIALDGRPGVAAVGDTDGGLLDGDARFDRAVGPMQFIPGTWRRWALDGNGDDAEDPSNLYDAASAAANYLCFGRPSLTDEAAQRRALLSYNNSVPYGSLVLQQGQRYRAALDLPDLPPEVPAEPPAP